MHLRRIEHLENRRQKCKMHTQERQLTRFFCILQLIYKENRTDGFLQNRTELEKSILHIPNYYIKTNAYYIDAFSTDSRSCTLHCILQYHIATQYST